MEPFGAVSYLQVVKDHVFEHDDEHHPLLGDMHAKSDKCEPMSTQRTCEKDLVPRKTHVYSNVKRIQTGIVLEGPWYSLSQPFRAVILQCPNLHHTVWWRVPPGDMEHHFWCAGARVLLLGRRTTQSTTCVALGSARGWKKRDFLPRAANNNGRTLVSSICFRQDRVVLKQSTAFLCEVDLSSTCWTARGAFPVQCPNDVTEQTDQRHERCRSHDSTYDWKCRTTKAKKKLRSMRHPCSLKCIESFQASHVMICERFLQMLHASCTSSSGG